MNLFEQVALGWQCLWHTRREWVRFELWGPWLLLLALQSGVILALLFAAHPLLSWCMAPLLRGIADADIVRYPELLRRLPALAAQAAVFSGWIVGSLTAGVATRLFADRFRGARSRPALAWSEALPRWPSLWLASLPGALLGFGLAFLPTLLAGMRMSSLSRRLLPEVLNGLSGIVTALLFYVIAMVMIERRSAPSALAQVPRTLARGFVPALVVVLLVSLVRLPLDRLALASGLIVDRGVPELAAVLAFAQAVVSAATGFLLTGSATLIHLSVVAEREEDRR